MASVLEKLRNEGILASADWVEACLTWLDQNEPNLSPAHRLLKVQEQWLSADLTSDGVQEGPCLPENLTDQVKVRLPGRYLLQVQYGYDIGNPAYGQLQKLRQIDVENQRVSADDSQMSQGAGNQTQGEGGYQATQGGRFQAAWEPKPSRMMFLTLTDGFHTVSAMEHEREPKIPDKISPGAKIELRGPLTCRRGIILITRNCFKLLGGEVEDLVPNFNLEKILGEKIGQTVDQERRPFAQFMSENNRNAPNVPKRQVAQNVPQAVARPNVNVDMTGDDFDDEDDLLLMAASQIDMAGAITSTQIPNKPKTYHQSKINVQSVPRPNVNVDMTGDDFDEDDDDDDEALLMAASQVDMSSAAATSTQGQSRNKQIKPKNYQQTKINPSNLFPKPKMPPPRAPLQQKHSTNPFVDDDEDDFSQPTDTAQFDLIDDDDELFNSIPEAAVEPEPKQLPDAPFTYLIHMKQTMDKFPTRRLVKTVKAVITTLASKMSIKKNEDGAFWHVSVMINDGTDSLQADISDKLLSSRIGSAASYLAIPSSDTASKASVKGRMKEVSQWLATVSGLFSLRVEAGNPLPLVEDIKQVGGLHLAQLRRRRLQ